MKDRQINARPGQEAGPDFGERNIEEFGEVSGFLCANEDSDSNSKSCDLCKYCPLAVVVVAEDDALRETGLGVSIWFWSQSGKEGGGG